MPVLVRLHISNHDVAESLKQKVMPTYLFPLMQRIGAPPLAIEKDVFQDSLVSNGRIRRVALSNSMEAMFDVVTHRTAAALAVVEHSVLCASTPLVSGPCLGNCQSP